MEKITDVDSILVSNLKIEVSLSSDNSMVYNSRIEEVAYDTFFIATPSDRGMPMPVTGGTKVDINFITDGGRYFFKTLVTHKIIRNVDMLELKKPDIVYKSELREFFRIDVLQRIRVYPLIKTDGKNSEPVYSRDKAVDGICINVSGGGIKFLSETKFELGAIIDIDFSHFIEGLDSIGGKVIRCDLNNKNMYEVGVNYIDLKDNQRDKIIKYTFKRQIEMRKLTKG